MDRPALLSLILVGALLPFERIGGFAAFGFNVRLSQVALALAWALFLHACLLGRARVAWHRSAYLALAAFFAAAGLSLLNADNLGRSLSVLAFTLFTASLAFLLPQLVRQERDFSRLRAVILASAALVSLFGLWQFAADMLGAPIRLTGLRETYTRAILGFTRIQSTSAEPLYFADYLLLPISLCGVWLARGAGASARRLSLLLGVMLVDVFLTSSRGGWLGLGVTAIVLAWLERKRLRDWKPLLGGAAIGLAALAVGILLLGRFFSPTGQTVPEIFFQHVTNVTGGAAYDERAQTIAAALDAWRRHPWIGVGFGGYGPFVSPFAFSAPDAGWPIVNNETLELLAETGVVGLIAFIIFLWTVFREALRARRRDGAKDDARSAVRSACLAALCGMLAQYQTFSTLYLLHIWFTIGLLLAASEGVDRPA